jgi:4-alpha-glucanotransferase
MASEREKDHVRRYFGRDGADISWDFIRAAWGSVADYAIAPLQDVLDSGADARMNFPGHALGNWGWRFQEEQLTHGVLNRLAELTEMYRR